MESGYLNNKFNGFYRSFYPNGQIVSEGLYEAGEKIGSWFYGDSLGRRINIKQYLPEGKMAVSSFEYYDFGAIKIVKHYFDSISVIITTIIDHTKVVEMRERQVNEMEPKGQWTYYDKKGRVIKIVDY